MGTRNKECFKEEEVCKWLGEKIPGKCPLDAAPQRTKVSGLLTLHSFTLCSHPRGYLHVYQAGALLAFSRGGQGC